MGTVAEFPTGTCRIVEAGGRSVGIYHQDGHFYAVQNLCPHQLAPICLGELGGTMLPSEPGQLQYGMESHVLRCIAHGWEFDIRTGEALFGTDGRRLATFPVEVEDETVHVVMRVRSRRGSERQ